MKIYHILLVVYGEYAEFVKKLTAEQHSAVNNYCANSEALFLRGL